MNGIYQSQANVINEYKESGRINITDDTSYTTPENIELMNQVKMPFKNMFESYCYLKDNQPLYTLTPDYRIELIETRNPLVKEAYEVLGRDKVRKMKHHQSIIKRDIIRLNNKGNDYKIVALIEESLPPQQAIAVTEAKSKLQAIYDELGLKRTAKATDLKNWYEIKQVTKEIKGKNTACIVIIRSKFMRLDTPEVEF